jgi:hypothetical protein
MSSGLWPLGLGWVTRRGSAGVVSGVASRGWRAFGVSHSCAKKARECDDRQEGLEGSHRSEVIILVARLDP